MTLQFFNRPRHGNFNYSTIRLFTYSYDYIIRHQTVKFSTFSLLLINFSQEVLRTVKLAHVNLFLLSTATFSSMTFFMTFANIFTSTVTSSSKKLQLSSRATFDEEDREGGMVAEVKKKLVHGMTLI